MEEPYQACLSKRREKRVGKDMPAFNVDQLLDRRDYQTQKSLVRSIV